MSSSGFEHVSFAKTLHLVATLVVKFLVAHTTRDFDGAGSGGEQQCHEGCQEKEWMNHSGFRGCLD